MVVDEDEERVNECMHFATNAVIGDASKPDFLKSIGVDDYDLCIVAIGDDFQSSLEITAQLKDCGAKFVVSRAVSDVQEELLLRIGADRVVFPEKFMADWTAVRYGTEHVSDYFAIDKNTALIEIEMPPKWVGKTLRELDVRRNFNITVVGVREGSTIRLNLDPDAPFEDVKSLLVIGSNADIDKCYR
jgi:trk system potassium uptake protein TrkA